MFQRSKKGFTLMEMLIVVAIIAILVAIAIPTFTNALTKAKDAADLANARALYAEVTTKYLLENSVPGTSTSGSTITVTGGQTVYTFNNLPTVTNDAANSSWTLQTNPQNTTLTSQVSWVLDYSAK